MKKTLYNLILFFLIIGSFLHNAEGQDLHYSQFYNSPININPASTGIFNGDKRFIGSVRDQWRSVPVPWFTFSASYDQKIYGNSENGFWGVGLLFNYDRQGESRLNLSNINLSGSYTRILNDNNLLTFGLMAGFSSRGFDTENLTWDKQWDGQFFNPILGSGEEFEMMRVNFLETAAGINYRWQKSSRTKIDFGIGAFHFIRPSPNFYAAEDLVLPIRLTLNAVGSFKIAEKMDVQLHALQQFQNEYRETVFGGLLKFYLNKEDGQDTGIHFGLGYRTSKSLFPTLAISYKNIYVGASYDIDLSDFNFVTNNKGGIEVHFRYIIQNVKPLENFKVCPIY